MYVLNWMRNAKLTLIERVLNMCCCSPCNRTPVQSISEIDKEGFGACW